MILPPAFENRFWAKVEELESGCWLWRGATNGNGYGVVSGPGRRSLTAHRVAYELIIGGVPASLTLDHLCLNKACVNPEHLEPVTGRENTLRGNAPSAINARKTHCIRGHVLAGDNLYIQPSNGARVCRICRSLTRARWKRSQAVAA